MPKAIPEEGILFTFEDEWVIEKYDNHPETRHTVGVVDGRKAVDFVGLHGGVTFFIEMKDFRGFRIQNKPRTNGELHAEIAQKVHDTITGLLLTHRRAPATALWRDCVRACRTEGTELRVVVWLEDDALFGTTRPNGKSAAAVFVTALKNRMKWFPGRVFVVNRAFNAGALPAVTATDLPGAAGRGGGR